MISDHTGPISMLLDTIPIFLGVGNSLMVGKNSQKWFIMNFGALIANFAFGWGKIGTHGPKILYLG